MTKQEVFTKVATHLLTQGAKAMDERGACQYHAPDGKKCAAGCLIRDDYYSTRLEGYILGALNGIVDNALLQSGVPQDALPLVARLQDLHDNSLPVEWKHWLEVVAEDFGLVMPEVA